MKRRKNIDTKKIIIPVAAVVVIAILAVVAILWLNGRAKYNTETSTVFILDKGRVVTTDIENFDTGKYSVDELTAYLEDIIDTYNAENGEESVVQKEYKVEENKATLILEYANTDIYQDFYGVELFSGTIEEALEAGYEFDVDFARVSNGKAEKCDTNEIITQPGLKVAIIKANTRVQVDGKIVYVSANNVYEYGKKYVVLKDSYNIFGTEELGTESTESTTGTMDTTVAEDGTQAESQNTEIIFDFGDEQEDKTAEDTKTEYSQTYNYIIYK